MKSTINKSKIKEIQILFDCKNQEIIKEISELRHNKNITLKQLNILKREHIETESHKTLVKEKLINYRNLKSKITNYNKDLHNNSMIIKSLQRKPKYV